MDLINKKNIILKDSALTLIILMCTTITGMVLKFFDNNGEYVPLLFVLAVLITSRVTNGYLYGIIASFISVICVNYVFTYPFFEFDLSIAGYPITFLCLLIVSIITSTLTTKIKIHQNIQIEIEKEKMRANLLRAVSHDLRTPLTSISGNAEVLLQNDETIKRDERICLLKNINEDSQWLIGIVENILSITRINDIDSKIKKDSEAAEEIISEAVRKFKKHYQNITINVKVPDEVLFVPMDAILIKQVLFNLLENAAIHGKVTTQIDLSVEKENDIVIFTVKDNGKGIAKEDFQFLFHEYFKKAENNSETDNKKNMGIGLSVCNTIVKAHGGEMKAKNNRGNGASFIFTLPLKEEEKNVH